MVRNAWFAEDELKEITAIVIDNLDRASTHHYLVIGKCLQDEQLFVLPESCRKILGMRVPLKYQTEVDQETIVQEGRRFCERITERLLQHFSQLSISKDGEEEALLSKKTNIIQGIAQTVVSSVGKGPSSKIEKMIISVIAVILQSGFEISFDTVEQVEHY